MMDTSEQARAKISPIVSGIAVELGESWRVEVSQGGYGLTLTDDTVSLFARLERTSYVNKIDRLVFTVSLPLGARTVYGIPGDAHPMATAAMTRTPKAVAGQLRKMIETGREQTAYVLDKLGDDARAQANRRAFFEQLTPFGARLDKFGRPDDDLRSARIWIERGKGDDKVTTMGDIAVSHDGNGGTLELNSLTADQILAILTYVKTGKGEV